MRIEVKGRNLHVSDDMRERIARRFEKVGKQVSELAVLEVELHEEPNPANPHNQVAEAILYLKGVKLRAADASPDMDHSIHLVEEELARQVKRHREKRRNYRKGASSKPAAEFGDGSQPAL